MQQARRSSVAKPPVAGPSPGMASDETPAAANGHGRIFASPLARRLARELGVDVGVLRGSGPRGRIVRRDVEAALKDGGAQLLAKAGTAVAAMPSGGVRLYAQPMPDDKILALYEKGSYDVVPHDGMRKIIAQRLTLSKQTIPHFYLTVECRIDDLLRARER